nr:MAG TPA: hypothetical protein [Caudoviricetes sp.]
MKRVISYIRFSSERQAKGDSLRRQSKMVNDWLKDETCNQLHQIQF